MRIALFFTRSYARVIRPGLSDLLSEKAMPSAKLKDAMSRIDRALDDYVAAATTYAA